MRTHLYISLLFTLICSQAVAKTTFGGNVGFTFNVGTHINKLGVFVEGFQATKHIQTNGRFGASYNITHWGNKSSTPELQLSLAILYAFGKQVEQYPFFDILANKTKYKQSVGYAYNFYLDKNQTSQRTGSIMYQYNNLRIITENDIFSQLKADKFRTAAALISYLHNDIDYGLKLILWAGDYRGKGTVKSKNDSTYKARYGYYDCSKSPHGLESHGILAIQIKKCFAEHFDIQLQTGIDAEQIRHIFQNKFIHDAYFIPDKLMGYKNLHFPMISNKGDLFLFKDGQKVRKPQFHFGAGIGNGLIY